jgi:hypothetical protein
MSIFDLSVWIELREKEIFVVAGSFHADGLWLQEGGANAR